MNSTSLDQGHLCEPFQGFSESLIQQLGQLDTLLFGLSVRLASILRHPTCHHATGHCLCEGPRFADHACHLLCSGLDGEIAHVLVFVAGMILGMTRWGGGAPTDRPSSS